MVGVEPFRQPAVLRHHRLVTAAMLHHRHPAARNPLDNDVTVPGEPVLHRKPGRDVEPAVVMSVVAGERRPGRTAPDSGEVGGDTAIGQPQPLRELGNGQRRGPGRRKGRGALANQNSSGHDRIVRPAGSSRPGHLVPDRAGLPGRAGTFGRVTGSAIRSRAQWVAPTGPSARGIWGRTVHDGSIRTRSGRPLFRPLGDKGVLMTGVLAMVGFTVLPGPAASAARRPQARPRRPDSRRPLTWHWPAVRRRRVPRDVPHSPSDPATPSAVALADAIRQQLTHPGSVSPQTATRTHPGRSDGRRFRLGRPGTGPPGLDSLPGSDGSVPVPAAAGRFLAHLEHDLIRRRAPIPRRITGDPIRRPRRAPWAVGRGPWADNGYTANG